MLTTSTNRAPLREGLRLGSILGLLFIVLHWLNPIGPVAPLLSALSLLLPLAAYGLAGVRAARQTGSAQSGAFAGVMTALVSSLFSLATTFLFIVLDQAQLQSTLGSLNLALQREGVTVHLTEGMLLGGIVLGLLVALLLSLLVGMAVGAIGGSIGRQKKPSLVES